MDELIDDLRPATARNPVLRFVRLALPLKSLALGAFGYAAVLSLLMFDTRYALAWSLVGTVALGSTVFTATGAMSLYKHWKRVAVGFAAAFVVSVCIVVGVLFSGVFTYGYAPSIEALATSVQIKRVMEHAHSKGIEATDWAALQEAGLVGPEQNYEGQYYYRSQVTWTIAFDEQGSFQGKVMFAGHPLHNIPDCEVTFNERARPVATAGKFNEYLPVRPRDME